METTSDLSERLAEKVKRELYGTWATWKRACCSPESKSYHLYGARGITMDTRWAEDSKAFIRWSMSAGFIPGKKLKRKNLDGDFTPSNCEWIMPRGQRIAQAKLIPVTAVDAGGREVRFESTRAAAEWVLENNLSKTKDVTNIGIVIRSATTKSGKAYGYSWNEPKPMVRRQPKKDLTDKRYGLLTVLSLHKVDSHGSMWECECACGNHIRVRSDQITGGRTIYCGVKSMHDD